MNFTCLGGEKRIKGNNMYGSAIIIIGIIFHSTLSFLGTIASTQPLIYNTYLYFFIKNSNISCNN